MIATVSGLLTERDGDTVMIQTDGGVGYEVTVPLGTFERLPGGGSWSASTPSWWCGRTAGRCTASTAAATAPSSSGCSAPADSGPSWPWRCSRPWGPDRTVRSIRHKDLAALSTVSGIGKKKAERLVLELRTGSRTWSPRSPGRTNRLAPSPPARGRRQALIRLGYAPAAADEAVRAALTGSDDDDTAHLVRRALQRLAPTRGGR